MNDIFTKRLKPGVLEWSGPELLLRMLEHEIGFDRPADKTVDETLTDIEEMARQAGPESINVIKKLKQLTAVSSQYFNDVLEHSASRVQ